MNRKLFAPIIFWISLTAVFLLLSASVSLVAAGYQFDWTSKRLQKTGLLFLAGEPRSATVTINGKVASTRLPLRLPTIFPGEYSVIIEKEGFVAWHKVFSISPGEARSETDIKLFLSQPEVSIVTDPELIRKVKENTDSSQLIHDREIRLNNRLVTRVSSELLDAVLSSDRSHVFFQIGKEVRVIEADGSNEILLYTLDSSTRSQLITLEDDSELLILDRSTVKRLRVR